MLRTFIQIAALLLTLEAAFFLAKGNLGLSAEAIAQLSSTKWDYNSELLNNLAHQRSDTWIGVLLLLIAFTLQMWNALWPLRYDDFAIHYGAAAYAVVFCVVIGIGAYFLSNELANSAGAKIERIINGGH